MNLERRESQLLLRVLQPVAFTLAGTEDEFRAKEPLVQGFNDVVEMTVRMPVGEIEQSINAATRSLGIAEESFATLSERPGEVRLETVVSLAVRTVANDRALLRALLTYRREVDEIEKASKQTISNLADVIPGDDVAAKVAWLATLVRNEKGAHVAANIMLDIAEWALSKVGAPPPPTPEDYAAIAREVKAGLKVGDEVEAIGILDVATGKMVKVPVVNGDVAAAVEAATKLKLGGVDGEKISDEELAKARAVANSGRVVLAAQERVFDDIPSDNQEPKPFFGRED